jgi:hypothetical protein
MLKVQTQYVAYGPALCSVHFLHFPPEHAGDEPSPGAPQTRPQVPQLAASVARLLQVFPHFVYPALQVMAHTPALQVVTPFGVVGQTVPQVPQLVTLVCRSTQAPLHMVSVPVQPMLHTPALHTGLEPEIVLVGQTLRQAPQLLMSVCIEVVGRHWLGLEHFV